jgi:hypothetical protein
MCPEESDGASLRFRSFDGQGSATDRVYAGFHPTCEQVFVRGAIDFGIANQMAPWHHLEISIIGTKTIHIEEDSDSLVTVESHKMTPYVAGPARVCFNRKVRISWLLPVHILLYRVYCLPESRLLLRINFS